MDSNCFCGRGVIKTKNKLVVFFGQLECLGLEIELAIICFIICLPVESISLGGVKERANISFLIFFGAPPQTTPTWKPQKNVTPSPKKKRGNNFLWKSHPCFSSSNFHQYGDPNPADPILPVAAATLPRWVWPSKTCWAFPSESPGSPSLCPTCFCFSSVCVSANGLGRLVVWIPGIPENF